MQPLLEQNWLTVVERFDSLRQFVTTSDAKAPFGDTLYATELFSSWVLLAYAAHESAVVSHATAAMGLIAGLATTPDGLPDQIREKYLQRVLTYAGELENGTTRRKGESLPTAEEIVRNAFTAKWAKQSILMRLERNAWTDNVRELLSRANVLQDRLQWMKSPWAAGSETIESRVDELVRVRNDIAHGVRPTTLRSAEEMLDWVDCVQEFSRRVKGALQGTIMTDFSGATTQELGDVNAELQLGNETVAYKSVSRSFSVGQHMCLINEQGYCQIAQIKSIVSDGITLTTVEAGSERVAVTFSRAVAGQRICPAL